MGSISNEDGSKITVTWRDQGLTAAVSMEFHSRSGHLVDTVDVPLDSLPRFFDAFFIGTEPVSSRARFAEEWAKDHRRISAEEYRRDPEAFWEYPWRNHRVRRHRDMERFWSSLPPRQVRRWNVVVGRVLRELDRWSKGAEWLTASVDADGTPSTDAVLARANDGDPCALLLFDILTDPSLADEDGGAEPRNLTATGEPDRG